MPFSATYIPYQQTQSFGSIALDYISGASSLKPFYQQPPTIEGIRQTMIKKAAQFAGRELLVNELKLRYQSLAPHDAVNNNIELLLKANCFTVCTAHQPNIFTGHLYFIYKILHSIKLCHELKKSFAENHFVPVYFMGSEDADLQELGEIMVGGKKYNWQTDQKGAVGRMYIDKPFIQLIDEMERQLGVEPFGNEIIQSVRDCYSPGKTIEEATFQFVHNLFAEYGLVILLPDSNVFKNAFLPVMERELVNSFSEPLVQKTIQAMPVNYKVQVSGRPINLFYLKDGLRERIEKKGDQYHIANTSLQFSRDQILAELREYPGRFSPNVILRPLLQEALLPNIVFVGGGAEIAYWLELKPVFEAAAIPYPVLLLRNSFAIVPQKTAKKITDLEMEPAEFFKPELQIINDLVQKRSTKQLSLSNEKLALIKNYDSIRKIAADIDQSLDRHVWALQSTAINRISLLEKKMLKAEKKKFEAEKRQVSKIKESFFPAGILQERVENILPYYSHFGKPIMDALYLASTGLQQQFCILTQTD